MRFLLLLSLLLIALTFAAAQSTECAENEQYFPPESCESGSRDECHCSFATTDDCNSGCMCKDGYCRKNGYNSPCVKRDCVHPIYN